MGLLFSGLFALIWAWSANADSGPNLVKVESGAITPFWLEAVNPDPNAKKNNSEKKRQISVQAFDVMRFQVSVSEFKDFLSNHPQFQKINVSPLFVDDSYLKNLESPTLKSDVPMTNVSWFAAKEYCSSLGMRLPTTNEWEYMAAASEKVKDASSDQEFLNRILDWYGRPQTGQLKTIGSVYKNLYGIWDLHGNVWEWVSDFNSNFITGESREDSSLNKDMFCGAGGQAGGNKENYAAFMRYAFRSSLKGNSSTNNLGFRCVRSK